MSRRPGYGAADSPQPCGLEVSAKQGDADPPEGQDAKARHPGANFALWTLTSINLLNFMDRYILSALKEPIQKDLGLQDYQTALPTTGMVLVYMVSAPVFGSLAGRQLVNRRYVLACGICLWSIATGLAGLAQNLSQLVLLRSLVGVGEAAYGTIALPMLADFFPPQERTRAIMVYNLAIPLGGALGFGLGSVVGSALGWRSAFLLCGLPGVVMAKMVTSMDDPATGSQDKGGGGERSARRGSGRSTLQDAQVVLSSPTFVVTTVGLVCTIFALGGYADWIDVFFIRYQRSSLKEAGLAVGGITVLGGIGGNVLGTAVATRSAGRCRNAFLLVPALFIFGAAFFGFVTMNLAQERWIAYSTFLVAQIFVWTHMAPVSSVTLASVPPSLRSQACGLQILLTHALGDVISPPIIGLISDRTGSLRAGMQVCWAAMLAAGAVWLAGSQLLAPLEGLEKPSEGSIEEDSEVETFRRDRDDEESRFPRLAAGAPQARVVGSPSD